MRVDAVVKSPFLFESRVIELVCSLACLPNKVHNVRRPARGVFFCALINPPKIVNILLN